MQVSTVLLTPKSNTSIVQLSMLGPLKLEEDIMLLSDSDEKVVLTVDLANMFPLPFKSMQLHTSALSIRTPNL
jgi:hypothetical protein